MNDASGNFADETIEMASESGVNANTEPRKRRSTRIVQAVPLSVTGVDALGRPFVERTSSLILNCHGCRYQSKHYVLKNMWVKLEIPHPETGQPPRSVRGRVAWIQRPRTVRQLFQVAVELEVSGNLWGIAFPPEDWFAFPEGVHAPPVVDGAPVPPALPPPTAVLEPEAPASLGEAEFPRADASDNVRVFPSPASATDASLQLARQVARLVADARQQIQAAAQEAASHAVSAERRLSFEQWEQKFAAGRAEIANETTRAIEKLQQETDKQSQEAQAAAAEVWRTELPRWLAPQLEQLTREFTERLAREALTERGAHAQQLETAAESLKATSQQAEETVARLKTQAEQAEAELTSTFTSAQSSWREQVSQEFEAAHAQLRERLEGALVEAQDRAAGGLNVHLRSLLAQLQEETARHAAVLRESAETSGGEWEQKLAATRKSLQEQSQQLESVLTRAAEAHQNLEQHSAELYSAQQQTLAALHAQLADTLSQSRSELHRESEFLTEQINARILATFEGAANKAREQFETQIQEIVQPHIAHAEEAIQRLAGSRSLVDAALTLQQERIR